MDYSPNSLLSQTAHRSVKLPKGPWFSRQRWENLLFYNVPVDPAALALCLPKGMQPDTFKGQAWISIVPFQLCMTLRGLPKNIWPIRFNELNVRVYVTVNGIPGVYFYSLDADDAFSVAMARGIFRLNYFNASMQVNLASNNILFTSKRTHSGVAHSEFRAIYNPSGPVFTPTAGTLEDWLTSRWCFFCPASNGSFIWGDIHHEPWPLQAADVNILHNTLLMDHGLPPAIGQATMYFSKQVNVLAWSKAMF
ncbi:MAG: DUF2071 domain-containing protein [Vampirovibrionales bacterium]|nr:DUF2071 domain-containing protein [Vampirovibrionales bacterium]